MLAIGAGVGRRGRLPIRSSRWAGLRPIAAAYLRLQLPRLPVAVRRLSGAPFILAGSLSGIPLHWVRC